MPIGFAKSIFTTSAAAGQQDRGYWFSNGTTSDGTDGAALMIDRTTGDWPINNKAFTLSFWWKGTSSDMPTGTNGATEVLRMNTTSQPEGLIGATLRTDGFEILYQIDGNNNILFAKPASFETNYLDNQWHHFVIEGNVASPGGSAEVWLDGTSINSTTSWTLTGTVTEHDRLFHNCNPTVLGISYNDSRSSTISFANIYLKFAKDQSVGSNITKFYDSGYVDLGTDGTASGLDQPELYMYVDSGSITNGGSVPASITVTAEGAGDYTFNNSGGPGS